MRHALTMRLLVTLAILVASHVQGQDENSREDELKPLEHQVTPMRSKVDEVLQTYRIPAPRGLIVDRDGEPIALSRAASYVGFRMQSFKGDDDLEGAVAAYEEIRDANSDVSWLNLEQSAVLSHWRHRSHVPLDVTGPLTEEEANTLASFVDGHPLLGFETCFVREYPMGKAMGHISGYARNTRPVQHGPLSVPEEMFPSMEGAEAFEKTLDEALSGKDGQATYVYSDKGEVAEVEILDPVIPGQTVVTTLSGKMQQLAYSILEKNKKAGALVAVDALSGDILALASYPSFDPNDFTLGISSEDYAKLRDDTLRPLFPRATMGAYPPGSTFKPFVALAAMNDGVVVGKMTRFESLPYVEVDGRLFHNWSSKNEGPIDVRYALLRSSNTWFYQVGVLTGGYSILETAKRFGFGSAPDISLTVSAGNLPTVKQVTANQAVANLSIGQGEVLVTPLQLAVAMGGLSVGTFTPQPRLVLQIQDQENQILTATPKGRISALNSHRMDRMLVREGMWGVVNHKRGTAKVAQHESPEVYGKTGTAQRMLDGSPTNVAWFAGYVGSNSPRLAFAAMVEGVAGETLSGGGNAAPLTAEFIEAIYKDPEAYGVSVTVTAPALYFQDELQPVPGMPMPPGTPMPLPGRLPNPPQTGQPVPASPGLPR